MKPSALRIRMIATLRRDDGTSTFSKRRPEALRMDDSRSAIGSLIDLPARFHDPRDKPPVGHLPETQPAESEVPVEGPAAAAVPASVPEARREFKAFAHFGDSRNTCHKISLVCCRARRLL